jgi:23S rRNA (guanosine2251-2'-O)-methyltransferase
MPPAAMANAKRAASAASVDDAQFFVGMHSVRAALKHGPGALREIHHDRARRDRRLKQLLDAARQAGVRLHATDRTALDAMAGGANHQGVVAIGDAPASLAEQDLERLLREMDGPPLLLILDGVTDPHNLGACLRTADASGVDAVIAPRDRSCGLTPVVCKVASGAVGSMPFVQVTNLARTLRVLQEEFGVFLVGTADTATASLFAADLTGPLGIVLGAEGQGMRRLTRERCDQLVALPMRGQVESLNVSVATGVCLYEALRQRGLAACRPGGTGVSATQGPNN